MEIKLIFLVDITRKQISSEHLVQAIMLGGWQNTHREQNGLRGLCIFYARVYVKNWISALLAIKAPYDDWHLYKDLEAYRTVNKGIS